MTVEVETELDEVEKKAFLMHFFIVKFLQKIFEKYFNLSFLELVGVFMGVLAQIAYETGLSPEEFKDCLSDLTSRIIEFYEINRTGN